MTRFVRLRRALPICVAVAGPSWAAAPLDAQAGTSPAVVIGRVLDAGTGQPVAGVSVDLLTADTREPVDTGAATLITTDVTGRFRFPRVDAGPYLLQVSHISYGTQMTPVRFEAGERRELAVRISLTAILLDAVSVVAGPQGGEPRGEVRSSARFIDRDEIEAHARGGRSLPELLQMRMPGAAVRHGMGGTVCVEFRGGRMPRAPGQCDTPVVVVDGVPVSQPNEYLASAPLADLESVEFLPAGQATARYGDSAGLGVLIVRTHRGQLRPPTLPGVVGGASPRSFFATYDWEREERAYPWLRSYVAATVGTIGGVAVSMALQDCLHIDGAIQSHCDGSDTWLALGMSVAFPLIGSAVGTQLLGTTTDSRGRLVPKLMVASLPFVVGTALLWEGDATDSQIPYWIGVTLVTVGVPAITTVADGLFRRSRVTP